MWEWGAALRILELAYRRSRACRLLRLVKIQVEVSLSLGSSRASQRKPESDPRTVACKLYLLRFYRELTVSSVSQMACPGKFFLREGKTQLHFCHLQLGQLTVWIQPCFHRFVVPKGTGPLLRASDVHSKQWGDEHCNRWARQGYENLACS